MAIFRCTLLLFLILDCLERGSSSGGAAEACQNPLFQPAWFSPQRPSLNGVPVLQRNLRLCPQYNQHTTCCNAAVENSILEPEFETWRRWFAATGDTIRAVEGKLVELQSVRPADLVNAEHVDLSRLHLLVRRLAELRAELPDCLAAVLQYVAGMLCFACRPDFARFATPPIDAANAALASMRPRVREYETRAVWSRCRAFGVKGRAALQAMEDAHRLCELALGPEASTRFRAQLRMFLGKRAMRQALYETIVLHPMFGGEHLPQASVPLAKALPSSTLSAPPSFASSGGAVYGPLEEGARSGFDWRWPREHSVGRPENRGVPAPEMKASVTPAWQAARLHGWKKAKAYTPLWVPVIIAFTVVVVIKISRCIRQKPLAVMSEHQSSRAMRMDALETEETMPLVACE